MTGEPPSDRPAGRTLARALEAEGFYGAGYDLLRLLAASIVVVHHVFGLQHDVVKDDPLYWFSGGYIHFGFLAVAIFFAISGFLVSPSLQRSRDIVGFGIRRMLRIYPLLVVVVLLIVFVLGPLLTTLPLGAYFENPLTYRYLKNAVPLTIDYLPGVVLGGKSVVLDGAMWTLYFEVIAYMSLAALSVVGLFRYRVALLGVFVCFWIATMVIAYAPTTAAAWSPRIVGASGLLVYFYSGVAAFVYADKIPTSRLFPIAAAVVLVGGLAAGLGAVVTPVCVGLLANYFGVMGLGVRWRPKLDISYGIYLLHYPVFVLTLFLLPMIHQWWVALIVVFCVTIPLAALSARYLERPFIQSKRAAIARVRQVGGILTAVLTGRRT